LDASLLLIILSVANSRLLSAGRPFILRKTEK
jgi:hypothetical protein